MKELNQNIALDAPLSLLFAAEKSLPKRSILVLSYTDLGDEKTQAKVKLLFLYISMWPFSVL